MTDAARRLIHHYYCRLPTVGKDRCLICSKIKDPKGIGTITVLVDALEVAILDAEAAR